MESKITTNQALEILNKYIKKEEYITHSLEVGQAMRSLAIHFKQDPNYWQAIGILHDIDFELFGEDAKNHTIKAEEILKNENIDEESIKIIQSHNELTNVERNSTIRKCLFAADGLTGLIHAYVLMRPDKDIMQASVKSINKKYKDKSFAKGVERHKIASVKKELDLEIKEFIEIVLKGMQDFK